MMLNLEMNVGRRFMGFTVVFLLLVMPTECYAKTQGFWKSSTEDPPPPFPPVRMQKYDDHVVVDNGIFAVTFSIPAGMITGLQYNGIVNILEEANEAANRGYWDTVWSDPAHPKENFDRFEGTQFNVIMEQEDQIEISFTRTWDASTKTGLPLNIDKRFIVLRGYSGFYSYGIFERLAGWPDNDIAEGRIAFKLNGNLFRYMAVSDERQRIMPTAQDRANGVPLAYPEAVLLTNPSDPSLKGEVDDKYQYSAENKDNKVHGWICTTPPVGFWVITPSAEFLIAGPVKLDLTSHVGPTSLSTFFSSHYAGESLGIKFRDGEPWKKVFGPVSIYLNSAPADQEITATLWGNAKQQMLKETETWPYSFPQSKDYLKANERGMCSGRLLVHDWFISKDLIPAKSAYIGLAPPGDVGSWQQENKGYQFWTHSEADGSFSIQGIRPGTYSLYAWVPGFLGDYKYESFINIGVGASTKLGNLVYQPPRNGPTLWDIGIPDRTAAEFYIPDPNPALVNPLYVDHNSEKYRQYGLWNRYTELYPDGDLVFTVGSSTYQKDWFFAHVTRNVGNNTYVPTSWKILFDINNVDKAGNYTLHVALASATYAELQVRINCLFDTAPHVTTGLIGRDNAIARHGIHGLYSLYTVGIHGALLEDGRNTILLSQMRGGSPFKGFMYDYIRFEHPPPLPQSTS